MKNSAAKKNARLQIRFTSDEHHRLVRKAAKQSGLTMNGWLIQVTLTAAREQLAKAKT